MKMVTRTYKTAVYVCVAILICAFVGGNYMLNHPTKACANTGTGAKIENGGKIETGDNIHSDSWKSLFDDTLHPDKSNCRALLAKPAADKDFYTVSYIEHHGRFMDAVSKHKVNEGHSGQVNNQLRFYYWLARIPWVTTICEIGFNGGHSTLQYLAASDKVTVYSFDIGTHTYTLPMADYLSHTFPGRLTLTIGNSMKTVPQFTKTHPDVKCDVVVIDGGHTYDVALSDLRNMRALINDDHHVLVYDDYLDKVDVARAWNVMRSEGIVVERYSCSEHPRSARGFVVGYYL